MKTCLHGWVHRKRSVFFFFHKCYKIASLQYVKQHRDTPPVYPVLKTPNYGYCQRNFWRLFLPVFKMATVSNQTLFIKKWFSSTKETTIITQLSLQTRFLYHIALTGTDYFTLMLLCRYVILLQTAFSMAKSWPFIYMHVWNLQK